MRSSKIILLSFLVLFSVVVSAQQNNSDISFSISEETVNPDPSMFLIEGVEEIKMFLVSFDISDTIITDTTGFSKVQLEIIEANSKRLIFSHTYSLSDLQTQNFVDGWHVEIKIPLAVEMEGVVPRKLFLTVESGNGTLGKTLHKTIVQ